MMRSMYSAVSSLKAHQLRMDVIGNNIANVNTVGFKGSRATFQEAFSQTLRGAGRAQEGGRGGTNPHQVGLGVNINSMDTFHIRGALERTDYNTDLMINGEGFFIVSDTKEGANHNYTRAGDFTIDADGNLLTAGGYHVLGYEAKRDESGQIINGEFTESLKGITISKAITSPPVATTKAEFEGNISSDIPIGADDGHYNSIMKVYDTLGNSHNVELKFERKAFDDDDTTGRKFEVTVVTVDGEPATGDDDFKTHLTFNDKGKLVKMDGMNADGTTVETSYGDLTAATPTPLSKEIDLGISGPILDGASKLEIKLDFTSLTANSAKSDAAALKINGYASGKLDDFAIASNGEIEGIFSNGEVSILGKLRLANFKNPAGLIKMGADMYRETSNSGEAMFGDAGDGGFGELNPGSLEMSNVDLSSEFTNMITTQRGFQANSRIITTSDEMLQEIVNMKR